MEGEFRDRLEAAETLLAEFEAGLDDAAPVDVAVVEDIRYYLDWVLAVADRSSFDWVWAQYLSAAWFRCQGRALADPSRLDEAIEAMRIVVDRLDSTPGFRIELVDLIQLRYASTDVGDRELLEASVHELRLLVAMELDEEDRALAEAVMGMSLREQFRRARADDEEPPPELLDEAQRYLDNSLDLPGMDDGLRVETMLELARLRSFRSVMGGTPYVLDAAAEEEEAIPLYEQVAPNDPNAAFELAEMMISRFAASGDLRERNGALRWLTRIEGDPRLEQDPAEVATLRGDLLLDRARKARDELPALIDYLTGAVAAAPGHARLATELLEAYYLHNDVDGMLRTVEQLAAAGEDAPDPELLLPYRALALATKALRGQDDLVEAERVLRAAAGEPTVSGWTKHLVIGLLAVVEVVRANPGAVLGDIADIGMSDGFGQDAATALLTWLVEHGTGGVNQRCAIALLRRLLAQGTNEQLTALTALDAVRRELDRTHDVAVVLLFQQALASFQMAYDRSDQQQLAETVELLDEFFAVTGESHPLWSSALGLYGTTLSHAHMVGGAASPSRQAVAALTAAVADEDQDPEIRARFLVVLSQTEIMQCVNERAELYDSAAGHCRQAMNLVEPGTDEHDLAWQAFAAVLLTRFQQTGDLRDRQAGLSHLQELRSSRLKRGADVAEVDGLLNQLSVLAGETDGTDTLVALRAQVDRLARVDQGVDPLALAGERAVLAQRLLNLGSGKVDQAVLDEAMGLLARTVEGIDPSSAMYVPFALSSAMGRAGVAVARRDWSLFDDAVAQIEDLRDRPDVSDVHRAGAAFGLAMFWHGRHLMTRTSADLDEALRRYAQVELASLSGRDVTGVLDGFADSCWKLALLGYGDDAIAIGFDSLRRRASDVLLQSDSGHAVERAADAAARARRVALRCADSGDWERAVEAVEWGRGLVLHSTTAFSGIGARLRALGHDDLAADLARPQPPVPIASMELQPSDLRRRAVAALGGELELLRPPPVADVAKALRALEADVLVHLVPGVDKHDGRALVTTSEGAVREVLLPLLRADEDGEVGRYLAMDDQERRAALPSLCAWAWRAVVEPLLREIDRHQPWVVLVPTGVLGVVPWHAAAGSGRTAVREAGFTYATSARQLCDLAARRRLPFDADPVVVSNPDGTLVAGQYEAQFLHRLHPGGRFYGQPGPGVPVSGPGTPDEVLAAWDDGVSLLHLGCHARAGAMPARSALVLARAELSVERVLRHATGRDDDRAGGLVVLAACESDLTAGLHDEALTLAAAYVAIGAAGVVGTKWKVDDIESALLMCVFYDFLRSVARPRDALRSAQLWALDEDREPPEGVDTLLRGRARDRALADPVKWAAFTHHGW